MKTPKVVIIYSTLTGFNEEIASELFQNFRNTGIETVMAEVIQADAEEYLEADICVAVSYSYESVDEILPFEMLEFYDKLGTLDLSGKIYGVLGAGNDMYEKYCGAVTKLEEQFEKTRAHKGVQSLFLNDEEDLSFYKTQLDEVVASLLANFYKKMEK